jgi:hypothetical protein
MPPKLRSAATGSDESLHDPSDYLPTRKSATKVVPVPPEEDDSDDSTSISDEEESDDGVDDEGHAQSEMRPKIDPYDPKGELTFSEYMDRWEIYFEDQAVTDAAKQKSMFLNYQCNKTYALICKVVLPKKVKDAESDLGSYPKGPREVL